MSMNFKSGKARRKKERWDAGSHCKSCPTQCPLLFCLCGAEIQYCQSGVFKLNAKYVCIYKNVNCCKPSHFVIFQPAEIHGKIYINDAFIPVSLLLTAFCCKESILMILEKMQNSAWCKVCTVKLTRTPADKYFQYSIWIENLAPFRDDPLYSPWIKMIYSI